METNETIVRTYLEQELKQKDLSQEDRTLLNNTLAYITRKQEHQQTEWQAFLQRAEARKEQWEQIHPIEGLRYTYRIFENEGLLSFGMQIEKERYSTWVFEIDVFTRGKQRIIFQSIHEELDELQVDSFEELEALIEKFLTSSAFKEHIDAVKEYAL